jgi:hypothetical protein
MRGAVSDKHGSNLRGAVSDKHGSNLDPAQLAHHDSLVPCPSGLLYWQHTVGCLVTIYIFLLLELIGATQMPTSHSAGYFFMVRHQTD